jgi:hypothetical protein
MTTADLFKVAIKELSREELEQYAFSTAFMLTLVIRQISPYPSILEVAVGEATSKILDIEQGACYEVSLKVTNRIKQLHEEMN